MANRIIFGIAVALAIIVTPLIIWADFKILTRSDLEPRQRETVRTYYERIAVKHEADSKFWQDKHDADAEWQVCSGLRTDLEQILADGNREIAANIHAKLNH